MYRVSESVRLWFESEGGQAEVPGAEVFEGCQELRGGEGLLGLGPLPPLGHEHALHVREGKDETDSTFNKAFRLDCLA